MSCHASVCSWAISCGRACSGYGLRRRICDPRNHRCCAAHPPSLESAVNGTTGDSMCLTQAERKGIAEAWVAAKAKYGTIVINHIGSGSIQEACELAAHAQASGCDAICAMAPNFFKPANAKQLAQWLKKVGEAAPKLPLYYYNFPAITGVDIRPDFLIAAIEEVSRVDGVLWPQLCRSSRQRGRLTLPRLHRQPCPTADRSAILPRHEVH